MEKTSLFKGTFHASSVQFSSVAQSCPTLYAPMNRKMGTLKDRNGMDLTEAEDIKKWQEYTEELYQKDLCDPMGGSMPGFPTHHRLHSGCQQIQKTQQWPQDWKRSIFIPIPKKGSAKECADYRTVALILHASKAVLKILPDRLQQYMNQELPDVQAGFRKGRGTRD